MDYQYPSEADIKDGVSVISAAKNRNAQLNEALPTWVQNPHVDEVVIVDWDSDEPVQDIVDSHQNGKIKLVRVNDQPEWILSWAYNLSARISSFSRILKLDSDVKLSEDFFSQCTLKRGSFYSGAVHLARNENERHLTGQVYLFREDFFQVNGYDERITTYGWDDSDLYHRLKFGYKESDKRSSQLLSKLYIPRIRYKTWTPRFLNNAISKYHNSWECIIGVTNSRKAIRRQQLIHPNLLSHIPHSDDSRVMHQDIHSNKLIKNAVVNRSKINTPWSRKYTMKKFNIQQLNERLLMCNCTKTHISCDT